MKTTPSFPLAASRVIAVLGLVLCNIVAIILFIGAGILLFVWPAVLAEALGQGLEAKVHGLQPWTSMILAGAGLIVALAGGVFKRLVKLLESVSGDPFTATNSLHLRQIGWLMIAMQPLGFMVGQLGDRLPAEHNVAAGFDFSVTSLLAALLAFVLAELFERARAMRDELEGTV
jgi:hypothetical protein